MAFYKNNLTDNEKVWIESNIFDLPELKGISYEFKYKGKTRTTGLYFYQDDDGYFYNLKTVGILEEGGDMLHQGNGGKWQLVTGNLPCLNLKSPKRTQEVIIDIIKQHQEG